MQKRVGREQPLLWEITIEDRRPVIPKPLSAYSEFVRTVPPDVVEYLSRRPYQLPAIAEILHQKLLAKRSKIIIGAPTGAGKGTILAYLCDCLLRLNRQTRILVVTPRVNLADDLQDRINKIRVGLAGVLRDRSGRHAPIQVTTIDTALYRAQCSRLPPFDVLMLDEVHHFVGNTWAEVVELNPDADVFGFTATTERGDHRALGEVFETLIVPVNYQQLLVDGFIVPCDVYSPQYRLEGDLARSPLDAYRDFAQDRGPTLVYERSKMTAKCSLHAFREAGIPAELITEETPPAERKKILTAFGNGRIPVLINVLVLTEGYDAPVASVAIVAIPCNATRWRQVTGRVLRAHPGKDRALVIDLVGNASLLGNPTWDYLYSLDRSPEIKGWSEESLNGLREGREENIPEILNCELYDHATLLTRTPVAIQAATSQGMSGEQHVYVAHLKQAVRTGKMTPQVARQHYESRFGKTFGLIDFRG